jgi:hypothetical protein
MACFADAYTARRLATGRRQRAALRIDLGDGALRQTAPGHTPLTLVNRADGAPLEPVASAVRSAGTVTVGVVWSCTSMVKVAVPVLPVASVALQVTVLIPRRRCYLMPRCR